MADSKKHTEGPWEASENAYGKVFVHGGKALTTSVGTEYRELIAGGNSHDTLTISNARLIAAAPELLDALEGLLGDIEEYQKINKLGGENNHWQVISRAAIAKAEGLS